MRKMHFFLVIVNFISETTEARNQCSDIFKVLKEKKLNPAKISFKNDDEIETFSDLRKRN